MSNDLFTRIKENFGPLGQYRKETEGYYMFPKLEGEMSNRMEFHGREMIIWSLNNYLGLGNHPEVREADTKAAEEWGLAYPMGARIMSGNSVYHEQLENDLAEFVQKEAAVLVNYGYQGVMSAIDALLTRRDVVVYDADCHACIIDGLRMHMGKRFAFDHNDIKSFETNIERASKLAEQTGGGILVITEGVFGMRGEQGKLKEICEYKDKYNFRLLVDDAHGIGTLGKTGAGAGEEQGVQDQIDVYFGTFAKSFASIGGFLAGDKEIMDFLRYNMRSQIFAKSMPMPLVLGNLKRLRMIRQHPEFKDKLWENVRMLQDGLKQAGFDIGKTNTCVTPVFLKGDLNEATNLVRDLRENYGIFCSIVIYPVIPRGIILLRLIPTAVHTAQDITETLEAFRAIRDKLETGVYKETVTLKV
ncbi:MAG: aminotransferase class I/II-fold pyridoxal phosphate-dependent enzyme [Bacteroidota bacterium]|nr:aminotransferase class I/II-fold pyridoxal phosphate-dependent enzyme [Bacteroidota bacterium]MDX5426939.1 aminotransferase class I/II-fold pyridoxal phosphate-dependent enzyme [Bacteroidota bacterium]MDX5447320.1 aminotransferase class I/II-fold pyridoxal phosphate-dependent enzyme [Bacteroidota bacterium]MDX5504927.1 aminotransferase class I/II-fold pyridoxal phosphate-dependent enzyme [Bacteroidota bacterium]